MISYGDVINKINAKISSSLPMDSIVYYGVVVMKTCVGNWSYKYTAQIAYDGYVIVLIFDSANCVDVYVMKHRKYEDITKPSMDDVVIEQGTIGDEDLFNKYAEKTSEYLPDNRGIGRDAYNALFTKYGRMK